MFRFVVLFLQRDRSVSSLIASYTEPIGESVGAYEIMSETIRPTSLLLSCVLLVLTRLRALSSIRTLFDSRVQRLHSLSIV